MNLLRDLSIVILASVLDDVVGDPKYLIHPVQVMGGVIAWFKGRVIKAALPRFSPLVMFFLGIVLGLGLIIGSGLVGFVVVSWAIAWHDWVAVLVSAVILASCLAGRSLAMAADEVVKALDQEGLQAARSHLRNYVGRDTQNLNEAEILRAVLETVSENAVDGVTAPLFYGLVGVGLFGPVGVAVALAYKAASTLDSMVGYRHVPYRHLGWFSAKTEDILTWLPCRLTVLTLGLWSGSPWRVWHICKRDAIADPSPNSGWSEAIYAAILGVQLGGENFYQGQLKSKPLLGDNLGPITKNTIKEALHLTRVCCWLWLGLGAVIYAAG